MREVMPSLISVVRDELLVEMDKHFRVLGTYLEVCGLRTREVFSRSLMLVDLLVSLGVGIRSLSRVGLLMWRVPFVPSFVRSRQMSYLQSVFFTTELGIGGARLFIASNRMRSRLCHRRIFSSHSR
ncbi:unnamed protein product [Lactuca virosa]|uniref:Uncharacterized protein n=1 Tax=Lactuca virosa TaxID=75947 RepID=A0AAU9NBA9_9ASTR|nr:unnamed protein product [Lactuca virosa]